MHLDGFIVRILYLYFEPCGILMKVNVQHFYW